MDVNGTVAEGFEPVRTAFVRNFEALGERGAAVVVYRHGRRVVDLWAGTRDVDGTEPWRRDTAQVMRSATKGVAAAVPLMLAERGEVDLDAPLGRYWPEFKAHGKSRVLVRHVLNHGAGLPVLDRPLTPAEALDPRRGPEAVAAQTPLWEPGTAHGYHPLTYGWLLDELVRRVTGRGTGEWIASEIAAPLGLADDLWLGLPDSVAATGRVGRAGRLAAAPEPTGTLRVRAKRSVTEAYDDPDSLTRRAFAAITPFPDQNDPAYRAAALPATNGIATAEGLARFYAALVGEVEVGEGGGEGGEKEGEPGGEAEGAVGGVRLFGPATLAAARAEESSGPDRVLVVNTRFGLGYMLHGSASPLLAPTSFGHPGRGGPLGFADPESGIAFGYVTNGYRKTVTADPRAQALVRAVRVALNG
ncbi:serine hydrolase domain-containing protein [Streptomyces sp. ATCC 21386]|uniref:serine hydrolase domain-containing protein n=1 Tax=Streptomyces sp. ATCC 21386 TaxID=2699428 RepID=UPI001BFF0DD3|nr:serine hydrolase domain-containing protein [Streptomyces sp. ATCC 21386]